MNLAMLPQQTLAERVSDFIHHEAQLLDECRYKEWLALFDPEDGLLWIPGKSGDSDPRADVSLIYDTTERLHPRIARLASGNETAELPPSKTIRAITNFRCSPQAEGIVAAEATVVIYQSREVNMPMQILPSRTRYRLRPNESTAEGGQPYRIIEKRVDLLEVHRYLDNMAFLL